MARKRILTRMATKKGLPERWRRIEKKKIYYFRGDYEKCVPEWFKKKEELDNHQKITLPLLGESVIRHLHGIFPDKSEDEFAQIVMEERIAEWQQRERHADYHKEKEEDDRILAEHRKPTEQSKTISAQIDNYLTQKQMEVEKENLTASSWYNKSVRLKHLAEYMGGDNDINEITEIKLEDFNAHLVAKAKAGKMAWDYAKDIMKSVIAFTQNRWELRQLTDLPRNLRNRNLSIPASPKIIQLFTKAEYIYLIDHAPDRLKLYLYLMLNIGATQVDIANLKQDEVDWEEGRITRRRSKSQTAKRDTPVVNYKLWQNTFALLKKLRSKDEKLVLLNTKGGKLRTEKLVGKKLKFCDFIVADYKRLCEKLGIKPKPLKLIRKTGASILAEKYSHHLIQYFLGHTPTNIADINYIKDYDKQLAGATAWLGKQFFSKP
jgi:integrase